MNKGENFILLQGYIFKPEYRLVGKNDYPMYTASLGIPMDDTGKYQFIRISAWFKLADRFNDLKVKTLIKLHGHIENGSYMASCPQCKFSSKRYTTDIIVDDFIILGEAIDD